MDSPELIKDKVRKVVVEYIRLFPAEFSVFKNQIANVREQQRTKWAESKNTDFIERKLYEVPETLWLAIKQNLADDEMAWFQEHEGRWFIKAFPVFAVTLSA